MAAIATYIPSLMDALHLALHVMLFCKWRLMKAKGQYDTLHHCIGSGIGVKKWSIKQEKNHD